MTDQIWRYHTPERDGHAPDDWVEGCEVDLMATDGWTKARPDWDPHCHYRYRPLQDATYEPDLLAQCLRLPQDQREALIEAMQKPQRDWADDVWDKICLETFNVVPPCARKEKAAAVIRSMCRPKEDGNSMAEVIRKAMS